MTENGFYTVSDDFVDLINVLGGRYKDKKERPLFCCMKDKQDRGLYWLIPTSDLAHRTQSQIERIKRYCEYPPRDIRSCFYHIGVTNRPAIFRISNVLPVTEKYIGSTYTSKGQPLVMRDQAQIDAIRTKLSRIIFDESIYPDKYEQKISTLRTYLLNELNIERKKEMGDKPQSVQEKLLNAIVDSKGMLEKDEMKQSKQKGLIER